MATKNQSAPQGTAAKPFRYAHPYYTAALPANRPDLPVFGQQATTFAFQQLGPVPPTNGDGTFLLDDIIGSANVAEIIASGSLRFHAMGDIGRQNSQNDQFDVQEAVADDMALDYHFDPVTGPAALNPAFLFHLGDVIYGPNKAANYRDEFYCLYRHYPGKIIGIPGNHDGEVLAGTDPTALQAFQDNFCLSSPTVPPAAQQAGIVRQMVAQPGIYWPLKAPFVDIIGLYSNSLENPGSLKGNGGNDTTQITWLVTTLQAIANERKTTNKALLIATHHPPFSSGGHTGSTDMLTQIDDACKTAGI